MREIIFSWLFLGTASLISYAIIHFTGVENGWYQAGIVFLSLFATSCVSPDISPSQTTYANMAAPSLWSAPSPLKGNREITILAQRTTALALFNWCRENIQYNYASNGAYRGCIEVLSHRQGVCGESAYLYVALARSVGLKASWVLVTVCCYGNTVDHACASITFDDGQTILVDMSMGIFDVHHQKYTIMNDQSVHQLYTQYRGHNQSSGTTRI